MDQEKKEALQKAYESITDFSSGWAQRLAEKFGITEEEVLNNIDL